MERTERSAEPIPEIPVRLRVNGSDVSTWSCSPTELEALGAGRLLSLGFARTADDILSIRAREPMQGIHRIEAEVPPERAAAGATEREHRREHGCGLRFLVDCRPDLLPGRSPDNGGGHPVPELDAFPDLFRELFDRSPSRRTTGGHHTTALVDGSSLVHLHEEVGRHNGADKAIGSALLSGPPLHRLGLITTARISGEIAEKAARAGILWIASRSVPTTLAVEIAQAARITVIARAAGREARVFE